MCFRITGQRLADFANLCTRSRRSRNNACQRRSRLFAHPSDGFVEYTAKRDEATPLYIDSTTYELDALREQNELVFTSEKHGTIYLLNDDTKRLRAFSTQPSFKEASAVKFVPSLLTDAREKRGFTKTNSQSPFDSSVGPTGEGPLVRYGDRVLMRVPRLESTNDYQFVVCNASASGSAAGGCSVQSGNDAKDASARAFSFQCPSGGFLYYRKKPVGGAAAAEAAQGTGQGSAATTAQGTGTEAAATAQGSGTGSAESIETKVAIPNEPPSADVQRDALTNQDQAAVSGEPPTLLTPLAESAEQWYQTTQFVLLAFLAAVFVIALVIFIVFLIMQRRVNASSASKSLGGAAVSPAGGV